MRLSAPIEVKWTPEAQRVIASTSARLRHVSLVLRAKGSAVKSAIVTPVVIPVSSDNTAPQSIPVEIL